MSFSSAYTPLIEATRGNIVESVHFGAIAIVDKNGNLVASAGDPNLTTYLRSSSKPFQLLPLIESGGVKEFNLSLQEIAIMCASHIGTDHHVEVISQLQDRLNLKESDLLCGTHTPYHKPTADAMLLRGEKPGPRRHNCSGKHTGFLSQALLRSLPLADYINPDHPVQQRVLKTFAEMCQIAPDYIHIGIDGCSAPVFGIPLVHAAWGFARLADPSDLPSTRAEACQVITTAMTTHPDMVSGPGQFDTRLMEVGQGKIVVKGGAEGYQSIALLPGAAGPNSPALGIVYKVSDGDISGRARPIIGIEILKQLGVLNNNQISELSEFYTRKITNQRELEIGEIKPCFELTFVKDNKR
ncbi:MAG: asparaginase [Anaerolineaceae bacterium]|nr:asparaginase [Anaerolineaceae bacterium]